MGEVASLIIGASSPEQVRDNVKASGMILPTELLEEIRRRERTTA
jgi:aryl-alcohol dehydrogenase-like predicted oxidoreductase